MICRQILLTLLLSPLLARAETITIATYNIERFHERFAGFRASTQPINQNSLVKPLIDNLRRENDKANWQTATVIRQIDPDVLVIEEGPEQSDLSYFNDRWLEKMFKTAIVFPTNTTRNQTLCLLLKPGYKILDRRDQYRNEPDPVPNPRGDKLFARGPAFCLIQSPGGYKFWVGVTHQKSKNVAEPGVRMSSTQEHAARVEATKWRVRESKRTHEIMKELASAGPDDVILLGDMNDDPGPDQYEKEAGADAIESLVGAPADGFQLVTKSLADRKQFSFHGYWRDDHRELIDHVVVTPQMKDQIQEIKIVTDGPARTASDHYPVVVKIKSDEPATPAK